MCALYNRQSCHRSHFHCWYDKYLIVKINIPTQPLSCKFMKTTLQILWEKYVSKRYLNKLTKHFSTSSYNWNANDKVPKMYPYRIRLLKNSLNMIQENILYWRSFNVIQLYPLAYNTHINFRNENLQHTTFTFTPFLKA